MQYTALEQKLRMLKETDLRSAAEYAYALAMLYKRAGDDRTATAFGKEAIALFDMCRMETLDECAALNVVIDGVAIPSVIHQAVVRDRLKPLSL